MLRFLQKWFGQRRQGGVALTAAPSLAPEWTNENVTDLRKFLTSETGQTLIAKARALECATALKACQNQDVIHPQRAAGVSDAINWLVSLSTISGAYPGQEANAENEPRHSESEMPATEFATT